MNISAWKKYVSEGDDDLIPSGIEVDICVNPVSDVIPFNPDYFQVYSFGDHADGLVEPSGLKKSYSWIDDEIFNIRDELVWNARDIFRILAWKTGKINQNLSQSLGFIRYDDNWIEGAVENEIVSMQIPYQNVVSGESFRPIAGVISDIRRRYCENDNYNEQNAWVDLLALANDERYKTSMKGIGTVYLITLFSFITNGIYPIYDRFAMASLVSWKLNQNHNDAQPVPRGSNIKGCSLPDKKSKSARNILQNGIYHEYINLLNEFCLAEYENETEWQTNRHVDQALWVYGHFFVVE